MQKTAQCSPKTGEAIPVSDLRHHARNWLLDSQVRQLSNMTLADRNLHTKKLIWFLEREGFVDCGKAELRAFFAYLNVGHQDRLGPEGACLELPADELVQFGVQDVEEAFDVAPVVIDNPIAKFEDVHGTLFPSTVRLGYIPVRSISDLLARLPVITRRERADTDAQG